MKRLIVIITAVIAAFIITVIPFSYITADPVNLVQNSDFSGGEAPWDFVPANGDIKIIVDPHSPVFDLWMNDDEGETTLSQYIITDNKNLSLSFEACRVDSGYQNDSSIKAGYSLYLDSAPLGYARIDYDNVSANFPLSEWVGKSFKIGDIWAGPLPDFNSVKIYFAVTSGGEAYFDNVRLTNEPSDSAATPVWVRDTQMKCKAVWVNEDGDFRFSFIYPYADNNWVKIYDLAGNLVYCIDMPYDNPNIIVDLPDGQYTVKTFHDKPEPLQIFIIGKP
jgi:hypothetical protein